MTYHLPHRWPQDEPHDDSDERAKNRAAARRIIENKESTQMAFKRRKEYKCLTSNI